VQEFEGRKDGMVQDCRSEGRDGTRGLGSIQIEETNVARDSGYRMISYLSEPGMLRRLMMVLSIF